VVQRQVEDVLHDELHRVRDTQGIYDREPFKYLIDRCHPIVGSEDEIPVVTEVSLPANLDPTSIKVLAGVLGVECIL